MRLALASDQTVQQATQAVARRRGAGLADARSGRLPTLDLAAQYAANLKKPVMFLPPDLARRRSAVSRASRWAATSSWAAPLTARINLWTAGRLSSAEGAARG